MENLEPRRFASAPLSLEGVDHLVLSGLQVIGGDNNLSIYESSRVSVRGGRLSSPKGVPGDSNHNLLINRSRHVSVIGTILDSKWARGDAINAFNSSDILISRVRVNGSFDLWTDKAADIVIDGTGRGGRRNVIRDVKVYKIVIAAGGWHRLENVTAGVVEISGEAYGGNPQRLVHDVRIVNSRIGVLYINKATTKRITLTDTVIVSEQRAGLSGLTRLAA